MNTVSILKCGEYSLPLLEDTISKSFDNIGGIEKYIKPGDKVLLKLNLVMKKRPDEAVTTHNIFAQALASVVIRAGGVVTIADSPGGLYNPSALRGVYKVCGMDEVAKNTGAMLNFDTGFTQVEYPQGVQVKGFPIINPVLDADVIINVPKLKTHMMTFYSGAVKNMYGAIPGVYKAEYHYTLPQAQDFCNMLVDLCGCTKPTLTFMDAIWGMEGQGPSSGVPRFFGAVLASDNPYALDTIATNMVGITPDEALTVKHSIQRGLCNMFEDISLVGDNIDDLRVFDLDKPPISTKLFAKMPLPKWLVRYVESLIAPIPKFDKSTCVGCGECVTCCPAKALSITNVDSHYGDTVDSPQNKSANSRRVVLQKKKCIRCFCCQELCPKKAVEAKRSWIMRVLMR